MASRRKLDPPSTVAQRISAQLSAAERTLTTLRLKDQWSMRVLEDASTLLVGSSTKRQIRAWLEQQIARLRAGDMPFAAPGGPSMDDVYPPGRRHMGD